MIIVADENMPFAREAFGTLGEVRLMHGRQMTRESVRDAELLMVRSITKVNRTLLEGSSVRFVGTATIGMDHVDRAWLKEQGIGFSAAPGSNANSVGEYVVAALLVLAERKGFKLEGRRIGIVGVGNVGSVVERKARALGMIPLLNDPPLQRKTRDKKYLPLDALMGADVITFHVPLEKGGEDPTWHLCDELFLSRMRPDAILINTSRGAVVDNQALLKTLQAGRICAAVLDVWEKEPEPDTRLLALTDIGTPHIAGYSYDGKVKGTLMIYEAACRHLGIEPSWNPAAYLPPPDVPVIDLRTVSGTVEERIRHAVQSVYSIEADDKALRAIVDRPPESQGAFFDRLRKEYPIRREFHNTLVKLDLLDNELCDKLLGIGFRFEQT